MSIGCLYPSSLLLDFVGDISPACALARSKNSPTKNCSLLEIKGEVRLNTNSANAPMKLHRERHSTGGFANEALINPSGKMLTTQIFVKHCVGVSRAQ